MADFLKQLRRINSARLAAWEGDNPAGMLFHALELGGEAGEVLNVAKKLHREAMGWRGSRATVTDLADELADDEQTRLFAKLPDSLKPIVEFALMTGQRKAEIVTMRWADVDLMNARATVWAKGQRPHTFPLTPAMVALIANQPKVCAQVFTYVAERSSPSRPDRVQRIKGERYPFSAQGWDRKWRKALKDAGIEGYRFHDNRHTAATRAGSIEIANILLGHSDMGTTQRYFHPREDDVRKAMIAAELRIIPVPDEPTGKKPRKAAND